MEPQLSSGVLMAPYFPNVHYFPLKSRSTSFFFLLHEYAQSRLALDAVDIKIYHRPFTQSHIYPTICAVKHRSPHK